MSETEPLYIGYVYLPHSRCKLRLLPLSGDSEAEETEPPHEREVPLWAFSLALVGLAVFIGVCGVVWLMPYGGLVCR